LPTDLDNCGLCTNKFEPSFVKLQTGKAEFKKLK